MRMMPEKVTEKEERVERERERLRRRKIKKKFRNAAVDHIDSIFKMATLI